MPARPKRVYFDYERGVELILKMACAYQGIEYMPCKDQAEIDRRLELFSNTKYCKKISEQACGVEAVYYEPEEIEKYKRQGKTPPKFVAKYPKAVWEFSRKLRYDDKDKIFVHTRTFRQFREYIGEPDFSAQIEKPLMDERLNFRVYPDVVFTIDPFEFNGIKFELLIPDHILRLVQCVY